MIYYNAVKELVLKMYNDKLNEDYVGELITILKEKKILDKKDEKRLVKVIEKFIESRDDTITRLANLRDEQIQEVEKERKKK